ncbi:Uma2 family endonuclease [Ornithinimicrobium sp. F0845]|uniref:Uma2 family endonuclease n=1 Tax=Ornithinimicrobium sp. F0845 TaxID=2926412 RepID=UPI001FF199D7|nr:Uma2 family endonuclease [Ornithinimicrobium sp. F0845]MCK0112010.1 Uma2 family endonuclease [Ornithinimicrobium sp. F0845]
MTVEEIAIYTVADLERERVLDDRLRWELLEGELVMTPSPRTVHQQLVLRLAVRLLAAVDETVLDVIPAPVDVRMSDRTVLQPDLVVATLKQIQDDGIVGAPVLAVEVLSPSTRRRDLVTKLEIMQRSGCPHYWVLDPDEVSLRAWRLVEGRYVLHAHAVGDQQVRLAEPADVTFSVVELLPARR